VIRFGQNQNLASPKTFDLLHLWGCGNVNSYGQAQPGKDMQTESFCIGVIWIVRKKEKVWKAGDLQQDFSARVSS